MIWVSLFVKNMVAKSLVRIQCKFTKVSLLFLSKWVLGLDIVTNKVTLEEAKGIPHHLMSFLDPGEDSYNVQEFQQSSLQLIQVSFI